MEIGDKILCKKSIDNDLGQIFIENRYYTIIDIDPLIIRGIRVGGENFSSFWFFLKILVVIG